MSNASPAIRLPDEVESFLYLNRFPVAAAASSLVSTIAGFPLDSIKSRLQVRRYAYPAIANAIRTTYAEEGLRAFFRGLAMPLITITIVRTTSFSIYSGTKERLRQHYAPDNLRNVASQGFLGGAASGTLISFGSCAFELIKIRAQLEYIISRRDNAVYKPTGTIRGAVLLYKEAGIRGLYYGFPWHFTRDTLGTGLYFCFYDSLRWSANKYFPDAGSLAPFVCGSASGIMSWLLIYPVDLVKTRVQRDALAGAPRIPGWTIFRNQASRGITRLYRGLGISAFRSMLTHGLQWVLLERIAERIRRRHIQLGLPA